MGIEKNWKLINISELAEELGNELCTVLLGFYVFTGGDCTSAFGGKGKRRHAFTNHLGILV